MEKADAWKKVASQQVADCEVFTVHRATFEREKDGERADFYLVKNPDWVKSLEG